MGPYRGILAWREMSQKQIEVKTHFEYDGECLCDTKGSVVLTIDRDKVDCVLCADILKLGLDLPSRKEVAARVKKMGLTPYRLAKQMGRNKTRITGVLQGREASRPLLLLINKHLDSLS